MDNKIILQSVLKLMGDNLISDNEKGKDYAKAYNEGLSRGIDLGIQHMGKLIAEMTSEAVAQNKDLTNEEFEEIIRDILKG